MAKTLDTKIFAIKDLGTWEAVLNSFWRYLPSFRSLGVDRKVGCHIGWLWKSVEKSGGAVRATRARRLRRVAPPDSLSWGRRYRKPSAGPSVLSYRDGLPVRVLPGY